MSNIRAWGVAIGVVAFLGLRSYVLVSMPAMSRAGDVVLVGAETGDHARYTLGDSADFTATSLGYDMSFTSGGPLSELGSRAVISYIDPALYAAALAQARCNGGCMAGPLSGYDAQGRIGHLLLIPADKDALASMKRARADSGKKFHLTGHWLNYQSGQLQGCNFDGRLGSTHFFLLDAINDAQ